MKKIKNYYNRLFFIEIALYRRAIRALGCTDEQKKRWRKT